MKSKRTNPVRTTKIERFYNRQLRKVARHVGDIIGAFPPNDPEIVPLIRRTLDDYSEAITGWAMSTATTMLAAVSKQEKSAWQSRSNEMALWLKREIETAPTGEILRQLLAEQVALIKSLPTDAGQRVHDLTIAGLENSTRAKEIAKEIARSGEVTTSRATLIARTEVARTASKLTEARAMYIGSDGYIWRTSNDSDVRESHRQMNGKFVRWDTPPVLSDGTVTHAGQIYNCRCYPEPVIPD